MFLLRRAVLNAQVYRANYTEFGKKQPDDRSVRDTRELQQVSVEVVLFPIAVL